MQAEGTSVKEARDKIWMMDIDGLLARGRPEGRLEGNKWSNRTNDFLKIFTMNYIRIPGHKAFYAKEHVVMKNFEEVVKEVKPSVLIGRRSVVN